MDVLWDASGAMTARAVCERLKGSRARAYTTIMTTLDRLHRKGLLEREKDGVAWSYRPAHTRQEFSRSRAASLATQLLENDAETGLRAFVDAVARVDNALLSRLSQLIAARKRLVNQ